MSLPVIETPRYSCTLPVTEKEINYRPFLVGEQKILLMHQEGDDPTTLSKDTLRLMQACICDDDVFVNTLPMADVEYLFLQVRIKSAGETVDVQIECDECKEFNDVRIDLNSHVLHKPEIIPDNNLKLTDEISIDLRYPSIDELTDIDAKREDYDMMFDIINLTVDKVINGDEVHTRDDFSKEELDKFIEGMSIDMLDSINNFIKAQPSLSITNEFECKKCGAFNVNTMSGIDSFFV